LTVGSLIYRYITVRIIKLLNLSDVTVIIILKNRYNRTRSSDFLMIIYHVLITH